MEKKEITGLSIDEQAIKVEIEMANDYLSVYQLIFDFIKENNVKFNMLSLDNKNKISFVINVIDKNILLKKLECLNSKISIKYRIIEDLDIITLVGLGFISAPALCIEIFEVLYQNNIEIMQSVVSNLSIALIIEKEKSNKAIHLLTDEFKI